ncbi:MAG TPA: class I tRNA ligase family protein, partial [Clostridiales bacterium]|nr:class I tRNA ligase family protein [Clostridiales bacterium]
MKKPYYITTAIPYASKKPHIGNTYEAIMADAVARYKRACGFDVYFLTGTDEHGQKVEDCAKEAGVSPKEYADQVANQIKSLWDRVGTTYDRFIRTTDPDHMDIVRRIFNRFYAQDDVYLSEYEGWYCEPDEAFYTESQVCKKDDCVVCPDCGKPLQRVKEQAYFFRMSKYADRLMKYIEENPDFIQPESRKKEMVNNFLKPGLKDLCVTRTSFTWGVPVEFDPKHVVYVWVDALSNYITG